MHATVLNSVGANEGREQNRADMYLLDDSSFHIPFSVLRLLRYARAHRRSRHNLQRILRHGQGFCKSSAFLVLAFSRPNPQAGPNRGYDVVNIVCSSETPPTTRRAMMSICHNCCTLCSTETMSASHLSSLNELHLAIFLYISQ